VILEGLLDSFADLGFAAVRLVGLDVDVCFHCGRGFYLFVDDALLL
jgi:hypothetical protein